MDVLVLSSDEDFTESPVEEDPPLPLLPSGDFFASARDGNGAGRGRGNAPHPPPQPPHQIPPPAPTRQTGEKRTPSPSPSDPRNPTGAPWG
jgi:hypothetical protein